MRPGPAVLALAAILFASTGHGDWEGSSQHEVPLDGTGSSWLVRATINGTFTGRFLIDTGASLCVLAPSVARRLQLPATAEEAELHTANGTVRAPVVHLKTVDVGGNRARDVPAVVQNAVGSALDGIIGLSYLDNFSYAIDPKRHVLKLR
jgi:clan AA aspartic protease (TIGR02281 family)